ncbi:MAG: class I SAM-dependent methyltransferase [Candidatus Paracaedibacter sp.]
MLNSLNTLTNGVFQIPPTRNNLPQTYRLSHSENSINSFATLNNYGYMLAYLHELNKAFVEYSAIAPGPVLDIGTAYGFVALEALKTGAHVIANDLDSRHLEDLSRRVPKNARGSISYAVGRIPGDVEFSPNSLGAVLASGVLHYLSPSDFSLAISNIATWLRPGGKFFLVTPTPYTNFYQKFLPTFKENQFLNKKWPGYIEDASKILPAFFNNVPKSIYLVEDKFIRENLKENGLAIDHMKFFDIILPTSQLKRQTNFLGVVACKL